MLHLIRKGTYFQNTMLIPLRALSQQSATSPNLSNVTGLSKNCIITPNQSGAVGAGKDKEYKNPEYFSYNKDSFAEAMVEMEKYRLPAPSNKEPFKR